VSIPIKHSVLIAALIFDLFSLIALMLGRLKMSTEEAIEAYNELSEFVFKEKKK
jgi:hypothetical protein